LNNFIKETSIKYKIIYFEKLEQPVDIVGDNTSWEEIE
jgi:hypothetical protein